MESSLGKSRIKRKLEATPSQVLSVFFMLLILSGSILLALPISSQGEPVKYIDALFTSTSAVCVTGLVTVPTGATYTYFGKTVIMLLIQFGGLGIMTFASVTYVLMKRRMSMKNMLLMREALNQDSLSYLRDTVAGIIKMTVCIESAGALLFSFRYIPMFGALKGIYFSVFHAISAFCNAGFDIYAADFMSLVPYANDALIVLTTAGLIILGGLGFAVITVVTHYKKNRQRSLQAKIVIGMTAALIIVGTVGIFAFEINNPLTLGDPNMSMGTKVMSAFLQSVTTRTAGFNSIDQNGLTTASKLLSMVLMFIGASPGSTGGGIKTTTFCVMIMACIAGMKGSDDVEFKYRKIGKSAVIKAFTISLIGFITVLLCTTVMMLAEPHLATDSILFEAISAFATVGLSVGITPGLSGISKAILIFTMYAGRVGPLTLLMAVAGTRDKKKSIKSVETTIMIG